MKVLNFYHLGKVIPEGAVYIGRAMPHMGLKAAKFVNPFKLKDDEPRGSTIQRYKEWLWEQIRCGKITLEDLLELEGKDLVCFCAPQPCHGDVLVAAVAWARTEWDKRHPTYTDDYWIWEDIYEDYTRN